MFLIFQRKEKYLIFVWLQVALGCYGLAIPSLLYSLNIADELRKIFIFFDLYILPIVLITVFTYFSQQIENEKDRTMSLSKRRKLDQLLFRDPRLLLAIFWLTILYETFYK